MEFLNAQFWVLYYLLFIIYINDFVKVSDKLFHVLFADDTNVFLNDKNMNMLIDTIQRELSIVYVWLLANKLSLNLSKTQSWYSTELVINSISTYRTS